MQLDVFPNQPPQHFLQVGNHRVQVKYLRSQHPAAAEGQRLTGKRCGALPGIKNLLEVNTGLRVSPKLFPKDLGVPIDNGQKVVEVVGDSACQSTDRLNYRHLVKLSFQALAARHILFGGNELGNFAAPIPNRGDAHLFGVEPSVLPSIGEFTMASSAH